MVTPNHFENVTDWQGLLAIANTNTGGYFWLSMSFMIFSIILIGLLRFGFEVAILTSAFAGFIITLFLSYLDLISWQWCFSYVAIILFFLFYNTYNRKAYG